MNEEAVLTHEPTFFKSQSPQAKEIKNIFSLNLDDNNSLTPTEVNGVEALDIAFYKPSSSLKSKKSSKQSKSGKGEKINHLKSKCNSKKSKKYTKGSKKIIKSKTIDIFTFDCFDTIEERSSSISSSISISPTSINNETNISLSNLLEEDLDKQYEEATIVNNDSNFLPPNANKPIVTSDSKGATASVSTVRALRASLILVCIMFILLLFYKSNICDSLRENKLSISTDNDNDDDDEVGLNIYKNDEMEALGEKPGVKYVYYPITPISSDSSQDDSVATPTDNNNENKLSTRVVSDLTHGTEQGTPTNNTSAFGIKPNPILREKQTHRGLKVSNVNDRYYYNFSR